jgi:signal transduction histidine kinase
MERSGPFRVPTALAHLPKRTVRRRLTVLYCALFFPLGVALVLITAIVTFLSSHPVVHAHLDGRPVGHVLASGGSGVTAVTSAHDLHIGSLSLDVHEFLLGSCISLLAMIAISLLLGWLLAGRVLRPLRTITEATQNISEHDLHQRLALTGPRDELTDLGDTIDGLLQRLERAFDSQRRFVANASHELRTPLTVDRATLQVALSDPNLTLDSLRVACDEVLEAGREQERLIDALLILARSHRGLDRTESVDLSAVTREVLRHHEPAAAAKGLHVDWSLHETIVSGDPQLLHRLVSNLVDNAIRHNIPGGALEVSLVSDATDATLTVTNTGPSVASDQVSRLLEPFQRGVPDRTTSPDGLGLGLSIVADIAEAHAASLQICPQPTGGLTITVVFPAHTSASPRTDRNRREPAR